MPVADVSARDRILTTADDLFYREGIRVSGVDTIIEKSGIAKTTFYRHFPSKDSLIVAYLQEREKRYWQQIEEVLSLHVHSPHLQLLDLFAYLRDFLRTPKNRGCPFINCTTEFPDPTHPGHQIALSHKRRVLAMLTDLCRRANAHNAENLAQQLMVIYDGILINALQLGEQSPLEEAMEAARILVEAQTEKPQTHITSALVR